MIPRSGDCSPLTSHRSRVLDGDGLNNGGLHTHAVPRRDGKIGTEVQLGNADLPAAGGRPDRDFAVVIDSGGGDSEVVAAFRTQARGLDGGPEAAEGVLPRAGGTNRDTGRAQDGLVVDGRVEGDLQKTRGGESSACALGCGMRRRHQTRCFCVPSHRGLSGSKSASYRSMAYLEPEPRQDRVHHGVLHREVEDARTLGIRHVTEEVVGLDVGQRQPGVLERCAAQPTPWNRFRASHRTAERNPRQWWMGHTPLTTDVYQLMDKP